MRKVFVLALSFVVGAGGMGAGLVAAPPARKQATGTIQGTARSAQQVNLPGVRVQVRGQDGQLVATGTTSPGGTFSFAGLDPGTYTLEMLDGAGNVVGTSAAVAVTAGAVASVTVTAAAAGAIAAAGGAGVNLFGLGVIGTVAVIGAAAGVTIVAIQATKVEASASR